MMKEIIYYVLLEKNSHLEETWEQIIGDLNHHLIVCEVGGKIISSCVCVIIPNLTRNVRPYAFVENVVTHVDYRGKGYATECLDFGIDAEKLYDLFWKDEDKRVEKCLTSIWKKQNM